MSLPFFNSEKFTEEFFSRSRMFFGSDVFKELENSRVAIFGVGGVGGWCAESLVRTGIGHILLVDPDQVAPSNINRQIMADTKNIGALKVEVLKKRLLDINPYLDIEVRAERYCSENSSSFYLGQFDCIIDAIDSLDDKMDLILKATNEIRPAFFSSMGAAFRSDPLSVEKSEFWKVKSDALAKALRSRFRKQGIYPAKKFQCVYSTEVVEKRNFASSGEHRSYASLCHVTAVFGLVLASLAVNEIVSRAKSKYKE